MNKETLGKVIESALGTRRADLIIKNGIIVNTISGEMYTADVAVTSGIIAGVGSYTDAEKVIDAKGCFITPGLIDGHVHVESSMMTPGEFARNLLAHGVTTVVADPHELSNVAGKKAIEYFLAEAGKLPVNCYVMIPSCVPATNLETSGACLEPEDYKGIFENENVLGLAEMMNFPGVINKDPGVLEKIMSANGCPVDGHAPMLTGKDLCAYIAAGVTSEHECITAREALEKLRLGMYIMLREGSATKNLLDLLPLVNKFNSRRCILATDDLHPDDIMEKGHIDHSVRMIISETGNAMRAVRMATLNAAEYYGLRDLGAIAPGRRADMLIVSDLDTFKIRTVIKSGEVAFDHGNILVKRHDDEDYMKENYPELVSTFKVKDLTAEKLQVKAESGRMNVIGILPEQIVTESLVLDPKIENGFVVPDIENDILKLCVVERHKATGNVGVGFVRGLKLCKGAVAASVAHDSHNIIAAGTNDRDILAACQAIIAENGGIAVCSGDELHVLPLPLGGLMSFLPIDEIAGKMRNMKTVLQEWGSDLPDPFMQLSFLALPVIPELKLSDKGLCRGGNIISLWVE